MQTSPKSRQKALPILIIQEGRRILKNDALDCQPTNSAHMHGLTLPWFPGSQTAEIVATIRFACRELIRQGEGKPSEINVLRAVMEWKKRRRLPLSEPEVASHIRNLAALGLLDVAPSAELPLPEDELAE